MSWVGSWPFIPSAAWNLQKKARTPEAGKVRTGEGGWLGCLRTVAARGRSGDRWPVCREDASTAVVHVEVLSRLLVVDLPGQCSDRSRTRSAPTRWRSGERRKPPAISSYVSCRSAARCSGSSRDMRPPVATTGPSRPGSLREIRARAPREARHRRSLRARRVEM